MLPINQILLGDCLEAMRGLPDGCVDALITDPPYGTTNLPWDKKIDLTEFWTEVHRVCKDTAVMTLFSAQPFTTDLINSNRKYYRYEIVWHKTMPVGFLDCNKRPLRAHENIEIFCRKFRGARNTPLSTYNPQKTPGKPYRCNQGRRTGHYGTVSTRVETVNTTGDRFPVSVQTFTNKNNNSFHPTAKPLDLMQWLVRTYTNPGDLILDPYAGSGSTCHAALLENRNYIGIERDPDYHRIACDRLSAAMDATASTRNPATASHQPAMTDTPPKLHRPGETLPISLTLLQLAETTRKDVLKAVEQWEDNPPSPRYADILGAREDA